MKIQLARLFFSSCAGVAIAASFVACSSPDKQTEFSSRAGNSQVRAPASNDSDEARERSFEAMLADVSSSLHSTYLSRLLNIFYRVEGNIEKYDKYLDSVLEKQKSDANYTENILEHEAYRKNLLNWVLKDRLSNDVDYFYRRLLQTKNDPRATEEKRNAALKILEQTYSWMEKLDEEDRAIMSEVFEHMEDVKNTVENVAYTNTTGRAIASVPHEVNFAKFSFRNQTNLAPFFKKHKASMKAKIAKAYAWKDAEADAAPPELDFTAERSPSSPEPVKPGTGPYGNITGLSFPTNTFVFTFDDGPHVSNDTKLFNYVTSYKDPINANGIPLTMFWQVKNVAGNEASIEKAKELRFMMNNHSWNHPDNYMTLGPAGWNQQINQAHVYLTKAFGVQPLLGSDKYKYYRCPYGSCVPSNADMAKHPYLVTNAPIVRKMIADLNLVHAYWAIDSNDWANTKNPDRTFQLTVKSIQATKRGIVLMHDTHEATIEAFIKVTSWLKDQNEKHGAKYKFLSIDQAVNDYNKQFSKVSTK